MRRSKIAGLLVCGALWSGPACLPAPAAEPTATEFRLKELSLRSTDRWQEAADVLKEAVLRFPDDAVLRADYGQVLQHLKRYGEAVIELKAAVRLAPNHAEALAALGDVLSFRLGKPEEGVNYLRRASVAAPSDEDVAFNLAVTLMRLDPPALDEARAAYSRAMNANPDARQMHWDYVDMMSEIGAREEARQRALVLASLDHDSAVSQVHAASMWLDGKTNPAKGIDLLQRAFDVRIADPDDGVAPPIIPLAERLMEVLLNARRPTDAETVARRLLVSRPTNEFANRLLIDVFVKTGRPEKAEATARQWAQSQPTSDASHRALADRYLARGQWSLAKSAFDRAVKAAPKDPQVYRHYASAAQAMHQWATAAAQYRHQLRLQPDEPDANIGLASCLIHLGPLGRQEARTIVKKWAAIDPDNPTIRNLLKSLH